jgi:LPS export ABC transporter permease LptG/LPS export ABC transporter permease LptF
VRLLGLIDRYVVREVVGPAVMGFVTYTFLLLMRPIFALMEQVFARGVPLSDALKILLVGVPHVVVLTIPMSYLFGVLIAVGRMNAENEVIALHAGGISVRRLVRPLLILGLVLTGINGYLCTVVMPRANQELSRLKIAAFSSARNIGRIEPRVFYEELPNLLLYVQDVDPETGYWKNVLAYDRSDPAVERLTLAKEGRLVANPESRTTDETWLLLEDVVSHEFLIDKPRTYRVNENASLLFRPMSDSRAIVTHSLAMRDRGTPELVDYLDSGHFRGEPPAASEERAEAERRLVGLEFHRRFAIPAACIVFGLLALPLGIGSRSGGRGRGFVLSIVVILVYYIVNNHTELLASQGRIPVWLGIWAPNLSLTLLALVAMARMGRWLGERQDNESWPTRAFKRLQEWRRGRQLRRFNGDRELTGSIPVGLQRRRYVPGFPTLLDRYIVRRLIAPVLMVVVSAALLSVVVDLTDRIDEIAKNKAPLEVVLAYYWTFLPQIIMDVTPFGLMIGVLAVLTVLERERELTALKGGGISLYRLMVPITLVACVGVGILWGLEESVVPRANRENNRALDRIKGRDTPRSYRVADRQWLLSRDANTFYNFLRYDESAATLIRFTMFRLDEEMRLRFMLFTHRARWVNGSWIADSGWYRQIFPGSPDHYRVIDHPLELGINEAPTYFSQEHKLPAEMSFGELKGYIEELEASAYRPDSLVVQWHAKLTQPLSALIMVLLALPFGLNRGGRRVTTMQGIALALGVGIAYWLVVYAFLSLGKINVLPPTIAAWGPLVLATLYSVNRMTTLRT